MLNVRRILCPIDFSEFSERAVSQALALARWYQADVYALHVLPVLPAMWAVPAASIPEPFSPTASKERMEALLSPARASRIATKVNVLEGEASLQIVSYANTHEIDLIVMGTHGRRGFERLLLGSVAEAVIRKADCPVMTVCHTSAAAPGPPFRSIVCPVDFSPPSRRALDYTFSLAQRSGAEIRVLHVNEPPKPPTLPDRAAFPAGPSHFTEVDLRERLDKVIPRAARQHGQVLEVVRTGRVWEEILAVASQADLVVMGVHGRGALDVALFGSNTNEVVRRAVCPVLTIGGSRANGAVVRTADRNREAIVI